MSDLIRDAPVGQLIRFFTRNKYLQYPEERHDFMCPNCYSHPESLSTQSQVDEKAETTTDIGAPDVQREEIAYPTVGAIVEEIEDPQEEEEEEEHSHDLTKIATAHDAESITSSPHASSPRLTPLHTARSQQLERVGTRTALKHSTTRADLEQQFTLASLPPGPPHPIIPTTLPDGTVLVDWYASDDAANPQNWSSRKKAFVAAQIYLYTLAVYMGSAIYAPSTEGVMHVFGVGIDAASLGLSMYVLAYGLGPMLWSPLSEIPAVGRNPPYLLTFAVFVILIVPTALAENFSGLIVLRFLLGFFGSPCLATGGASLQDMYSLIKLPYVLSLWAFAATCGPSLGPIIAGFSVAAKDWRWSQWEMLWLSAPIWLCMFFFLPETSPSNILLRRARRLRSTNGDARLKSQSEIEQVSLSVRDVAVESLWRPVQMMVLDPAIAFTAVYTALVYGIYYSFFEAFPMVYIGMYGFSLGQMGLTFLSITVGVTLGIAGYWSYVYWVVEPEIREKGLGAPERRLIPALFVSFLCPVGLFIFAWASNPSVHWIGSVIGIGIFTVGVFILLQCIFLYLPLTYPQYAASLFAGNDFTRSSLAAAAIHFSRPLFVNLGVARGVTLLGGLTCGCIFGIFALYFYGDKLRARSKFAAK